MKLEKPKFGKVSTTSVIDKEGSTSTFDTNYVNGDVKLPVRNRFEIKVRVCTQAEEHAEYMKFSQELRENPYMLDACFRIDRSSIGDKKGFYYVVKCFTRLEY